MFLSSTTGRFSVPTCRTAPRRAQEAVKAGRRPPPQAAQCGLDGREHGATLNQVGSARFLSRHTLRGYRPLLFLLATMVGSPIWIRTSGSALPLVVSRVSEIGDPGRASSRLPPA